MKSLFQYKLQAAATTPAPVPEPLQVPALTLSSFNSKQGIVKAATDKNTSLLSFELATNADFENATVVNQASTIKTFAGLLADTDYYVRAKAIGKAGYINSGYSEPVAFKTLKAAVITYTPFSNPHVGDAPINLYISSTNSITPIKAVVNDMSKAKFIGGLLSAVAVGVGLTLTLSQPSGNGYDEADKVIIPFAVLEPLHPEYDHVYRKYNNKTYLSGKWYTKGFGYPYNSDPMLMSMTSGSELYFSVSGATKIMVQYPLKENNVLYGALPTVLQVLYRERGTQQWSDIKRVALDQVEDSGKTSVSNNPYFWSKTILSGLTSGKTYDVKVFTNVSQFNRVWSSGFGTVIKDITVDAGTIEPTESVLKKALVMFIGDSLTAGVWYYCGQDNTCNATPLDTFADNGSPIGLDNNAAENWIGLASQELGFTVYRNGYGGTGITRTGVPDDDPVPFVQDNIKLYAANVPVILNAKEQPEVIVVTVMTNDTFNKPPVATFKEGYRGMIRDLKQRYPATKGFLLIPAVGQFYNSPSGDDPVAYYKDAIKELADEESKCFFADTKDLDVETVSDNTHWNVQGSRTMADFLKHQLLEKFPNTF